MVKNLLTIGIGCIVGWLMAGCDTPGRRLRSAAQATGNPEMHRVAEHYADDPLRAEAARFLLENLRGHATRTFDLVQRRTGEVSDYSIYRPEITGSNYRTALDSLGLAVRYRTENDEEAMTADYLIRNIDLAFDARERYPWARHYSDSVFIRYVLPYRIDTEELTDWRTFFRTRYEPMIDTMAGRKDIRGVARLIIRDIRKWFGFHPEALMLKPAFTPEEAMACGRGECNSAADIFVLALRAMGIAATKDMIPVWGTSDGGHVEAVYFDELGNPVLLDTGEWLAAGPPRIYRMEFDRSAEAARRFGQPYFRAVTGEYVATSNPRVAFDSVAGPDERAALAVFSNERWRPAVWAERREGKVALFREIGRGILYLPVLTDGRSVRPAGRPFRLDPRSNLQYHEPNLNRLVTIDLTPLIREAERDTLNPNHYYVAYWTGRDWRECGHPIVRRSGGSEDGLTYSVAGVPDEAIYGLFDKRTGRTYHRRIFRNGRGIARRF
ncbi:hypothetical protein [uncultured Rikenella sp.]|uniref:hypothetical protein n=1 Tax=uncultured Rikenella sp. TaxID=368003 RepID=UPI0025EBBB59|nr:hypothetical protein [uncultured Rikenella sp.]